MELFINYFFSFSENRFNEGLPIFKLMPTLRRSHGSRRPGSRECAQGGSGRYSENWPSSCAPTTRSSYLLLASIYSFWFSRKFINIWEKSIDINWEIWKIGFSQFCSNHNFTQLIHLKNSRYYLSVNKSIRDPGIIPVNSKHQKYLPINFFNRIFWMKTMRAGLKIGM